MATSGVVTYTATGADIIRRAYLILGLIDEVVGPSSAQSSDGLIALNMLVKSWSGQRDFAPGLKVWTRRRSTVFLQKDQSSYRIGPGASDDNATETYVRSTLTASVAAAGTALIVDTITGISASDKLGVQLDTGYIQWTTVSGAPASLTITAATGLTSAAAAGNYVYTYTTKQRKPLEIVTANLRDENGKDISLNALNVQQYESIFDKRIEADPVSYLYEMGLTYGYLRLDTAPQDVTKVVNLTYLSPVEDFSSSSNDADYPQVWFRALAFGLARDLAGAGAWSQDLEGKFQEALAIAKASDPQIDRSFFECNAW